MVERVRLAAATSLDTIVLPMGEMAMPAHGKPARAMPAMANEANRSLREGRDVVTAGACFAKKFITVTSILSLSLHCLHAGCLPAGQNLLRELGNYARDSGWLLPHHVTSKNQKLPFARCLVLPKLPIGGLAQA